MRFYIFTFLLLLIIDINAESIEIWSKTAIVIDYETEQVLFEKNSDLQIPPASMTKLVTLYMVYKQIEAKKVSKNDIVPISSNADYKNLPRDSSLMFIEEGQIVTLFELMMGLAIPSGNDAAIAIAEYLFGSVEIYLKNVNLEMSKLGFKDLKFVDSSGFNDNNSITVSEFVQFCFIFMKKYPDAKEELFSLDSFTYPKKQNGYTSIGSITQYNHNPLVNVFPNCDGLKTGFIYKSGMNVSLTAYNNDRRVIAVLAGVIDKDKKKAENKRFYDSVTLLNHTLNNFINIKLDKIDLPPIKVINGSTNYLKPRIPYKRTISFSDESQIFYDFVNLIAPVKQGEYLGNVTIKTDDNISIKYPVYSDEDVFIIN